MKNLKECSTLLQQIVSTVIDVFFDDVVFVRKFVTVVKMTFS